MHLQQMGTGREYFILAEIRQTFRAGTLSAQKSSQRLRSSWRGRVKEWDILASAILIRTCSMSCDSGGETVLRGQAYMPKHRTEREQARAYRPRGFESSVGKSSDVMPQAV